MCQVSLGLKEVQVRAHDFNHNNVPFSLENQVISMFRCLLPKKLALVPASRYNCDVKESNLNVCAKFH